MNKFPIADVVIDLRYGDCGKGKVTYCLTKDSDYDYVVRWQGGPNAGHTIYHKGKKLVTHSWPVGVFHNITSVIGGGCVLNERGFFEEGDYLVKAGVKEAYENIKIAYNTHIITDDHITEDSKDVRIGSCRKGVGPAYTSKFARTGKRAEDIASLKEFLVDTTDILNKPDNIILFEGAQGHELDINFGDYPYVTCSSPTIGGIFSTGVPPQSIRHVFGLAKIYDTYVGAKDFEPNDSIFDTIREAGGEYGATTGRPRQCNWLNWNALLKAQKANGVTEMIINKIDVMEEVGVYKLIVNNEELEFNNIIEMQQWIKDHNSVKVTFSSSKVTI